MTSRRQKRVRKIKNAIKRRRNIRKRRRNIRKRNSISNSQNNNYLLDVFTEKYNKYNE